MAPNERALVAAAPKDEVCLASDDEISAAIIRQTQKIVCERADVDTRWFHPPRRGDPGELFLE